MTPDHAPPKPPPVRDPHGRFAPRSTKPGDYLCNACGFRGEVAYVHCRRCGRFNSVHLSPLGDTASPPAAWDLSRDPDDDGEEQGPPEPAPLVLPAGREIVCVADIEEAPVARFSCGIRGLDHVLGGGVPESGVVILSGDPGAGKSTLVTQLVHECCTRGLTSYYASGEEQLKRLRERFTRLQIDPRPYRELCRTERTSVVEDVVSGARAVRARLVVLDSLGVLTSREGRDRGRNLAPCIKYLMEYAEDANAFVVCINHVTKSGEAAGTMSAIHDADASLRVSRLEDDEDVVVLSVDGVKNRFGASNVSAHFDLTPKGLRDKALLERDVVIG